MKKIKITFCLVILSVYNVAAEGVVVDFLRSTGKIYSVVAVICIMFVGLALYMFRLDRKISKIENQLKDE